MTGKEGRPVGWVVGGDGSPLPRGATVTLQEASMPANSTAESVGKRSHCCNGFRGTIQHVTFDPAISSLAIYSTDIFAYAQ